MENAGDIISKELIEGPMTVEHLIEAVNGMRADTSTSNAVLAYNFLLATTLHGLLEEQLARTAGVKQAITEIMEERGGVHKFLGISKQRRSPRVGAASKKTVTPAPAPAPAKKPRARKATAETPVAAAAPAAPSAAAEKPKRQYTRKPKQ